MGPFVSEDHQLVQKGDLDLPPAELFRSTVSALISEFCEACPSTTVVLIPSCKDVISPWCAMPQPPLGSKSCEGQQDLEAREEDVLGLPSADVAGPGHTLGRCLSAKSGPVLDQRDAVRSISHRYPFPFVVRGEGTVCFLAKPCVILTRCGPMTLGIAEKISINIQVANTVRSPRAASTARFGTAKVSCIPRDLRDWKSLVLIYVGFIAVLVTGISCRSAFTRCIRRHWERALSILAVSSSWSSRLCQMS
ncbi:MAG: hypothetical protein BJ554DRAFT_3525 [Olpidium bornovanus]|uniref:DNA polymerase alpha subunit B n=1 Tax=Olpidium bornovanus TaxID=278681 RepID=A0A8H8DFG5_9FUNG|nr:MAG: hypothetical protein BJ554DRAFT_3525 [Olpidium bornovanus]